MSKEFGGAWLDAVVLDMLRETGPIDPRWPKSEAPERQPGEPKRDFANRNRMYHDDWLEEDKKKQEAAVGALTAGTPASAVNTGVAPTASTSDAPAAAARSARSQQTGAADAARVAAAAEAAAAQLEADEQAAAEPEQDAAAAEEEEAPPAAADEQAPAAADDEQAAAAAAEAEQAAAAAAEAEKTAAAAAQAEKAAAAAAAAQAQKAPAALEVPQHKGRNTRHASKAAAAGGSSQPTPAAQRKNSKSQQQSKDAPAPKKGKDQQKGGRGAEQASPDGLTQTSLTPNRATMRLKEIGKRTNARRTPYPQEVDAPPSSTNTQQAAGALAALGAGDGKAAAAAGAAENDDHDDEQQDSDVEIVGTSSGDDGVEIVHERDAPVPAGDGALPMPGAPALSAPARTGAHSNESTDNEEEGGGGDEQQQQQEDDAGAGAGGGSKKKRKAECPALEGVELEDPNAELVLEPLEEAKCLRALGILMPIKLIPKYISEVEAKLTAGNITEDEAEKETAFLMGRLRDVTPDNYVKKKEGLVPKHPGTFQPLMPEALRPNTDNLLRMAKKKAVKDNATFISIDPETFPQWHQDLQQEPDHVLFKPLAKEKGESSSSSSSSTWVRPAVPEIKWQRGQPLTEEGFYGDGDELELTEGYKRPRIIAIHPVPPYPRINQLKPPPMKLLSAFYARVELARRGELPMPTHIARMMHHRPDGKDKQAWLDFMVECEHAADSEWNLWPMPRAWHELAAEQEMAWVAKTGTNSDRQTKRAGGGDDDDEEEEVEDMDTEQPSPKASKGKKRAAPAPAPAPAAGGGKNSSRKKQKA